MTLPPLPEPARITAVQFCDDGLWFTDDQMRAYATAAVLQVTAEPVGYTPLAGIASLRAGQGPIGVWPASTCCEHPQPLYASPPPPQRQPLSDWDVFNGSAQVASGLSFEEAMDYMTPARVDRGWTVVCVINKDNMPHGIGEQP